MSYEVGTHIDLSHLNRTKEIVAADSGWKSWQFPVGTSVGFTAELKAIIHIPVVFA